ncbi:reverse transcriptase domain-containing protein [Tanacetum coccineum]
MREAKGQIVKKFFGQGEQVLQEQDKVNKGTSGSKEKLQKEPTPTPRAWRLYIKREPSMEGAGAGMVLVDPEEREYSHAIHLNLHASEEDKDYEALLARLIASTGRGMKDLHVFVDSRLLVDQAEGNRIPRIEGAIRYMEEIMDATAPFYRFRITYLPKALNPKAEALMGLASIQLEFMNQKVSTGVKT